MYYPATASSERQHQKIDKEQTILEAAYISGNKDIIDLINTHFKIQFDYNLCFIQSKCKEVLNYQALNNINNYHLLLECDYDTNKHQTTLTYPECDAQLESYFNKTQEIIDEPTPYGSESLVSFALYNHSQEDGQRKHNREIFKNYTRVI